MTKSEMKEQIRKELNLDEAMAVVEAVTELLDENPEVLEGISALLVKYVKLVTPIFHELRREWQRA